jgi:DNA polymerase IIIc chi subunit
MKPEINFYQVDEAIGKSLAPLVVKILEEKKRVLIFCKDENLIKEIDLNLWSFGRSKFIPHITIFDSEFDLKRQVALITNKEENANLANYLIFIDDVVPSFLESFERVFHFFEEGKNSKKFKPTNFYKKEQGKWVKK